MVLYMAHKIVAILMQKLPVKFHRCPVKFYSFVGAFYVSKNFISSEILAN